MPVIVEFDKFEFITPPNLGTYRVSNNYDIPITFADGNIFPGTITFSITAGTLPPSLQLDSSTGYIYGYAEYQSDYIQSYSFTIQAKKDFVAGGSISSSTTFSMNIKGYYDTNIEWVTTGTLGQIIVGYPSELKVQAVETINNFEIEYSLVAGSLPPGLNLSKDGAIYGQVDYGTTSTITTGTYTFTVSAITAYDSQGEEKTFNVESISEDSTKYTKIYVKPFLSKEKRTQYQTFINNPEIFIPQYIYRYFDSNFGVQSDPKMILDFGIEQIPLDQYTQALRQNFYKRRFTLGKVKTAIAKNDAGETVYEVIYLDVIDNLKDVSLTLYSNRNVSLSYSGGSAGQIIYGDLDSNIDSIYYPASTKNMRIQLSRIQLDDYSTIKVNRQLEPRYMKTAQTTNSLPTNYITVIPLCYVKPGYSKQILKRIAAYNFKFNMLDFEIDRLVVQTSLDNSSAKYLLFGRDSISDTLVTDVTLYQGDIFWQFDDGVQLTRTS